MRVIRRAPDERVAARTPSLGCQDREVGVTVLVGREKIG